MRRLLFALYCAGTRQSMRCVALDLALPHANLFINRFLRL